MFLYILNIPQYEAIKIGVAKGYSRIRQHLETYGDIDFERSYVVHAKSGDTIRLLERQLLEDYIEYKVNIKEIMNKDGYTEIRKITILNDVLDDIRFKAMRFESKEIKIVKGIKIETKLKKDIFISKTGIGKYLYGKNDGLEVIPDFILKYPIFNCTRDNIKSEIYDCENIKVEVNNDKDGICNIYDYVVLIKIINIYLKKIKIKDLRFVLNEKRDFNFYYSEILNEFDYKYQGDSLKKILLKSLNRLSNTSITIYENGSAIYDKFRLIELNIPNQKDKTITINETLLSEISTGKFIYSKELTKIKDIKSNMSMRIFNIIMFLKSKKDNVFKIEYEYLYNILPFNKSDHGYRNRVLRDHMDELKSAGLILEYKKNKNVAEIYL